MISIAVGLQISPNNFKIDKVLVFWKEQLMNCLGV